MTNHTLAPGGSKGNAAVGAYGKNPCLRPSPKRWHGLYGNRSRLRQANAAGHYTRQSGPGKCYPFRRLGAVYNGLVDLGYQKHYRVHHGNNEFANGKRHINGIESFWSYAKRRLMKFHGIPKKTFYLHLKECEFRFNYRNQKYL